MVLWSPIRPSSDGSTYCSLTSALSSPCRGDRTRRPCRNGRSPKSWMCSTRRTAIPTGGGRTARHYSSYAARLHQPWIGDRVPHRHQGALQAFGGYRWPTSYSHIEEPQEVKASIAEGAVKEPVNQFLETRELGNKQGFLTSENVRKLAFSRLFVALGCPEPSPNDRRDPCVPQRA